MHTPLEIIQNHRVVAIVRLNDLTHAVDLTWALLRGGIQAIEFTMTNPLALEAISQVLKAVPAFSDGIATLGVGSVRRPEQAQSAIDAGAQFVVTPTLGPAVIQHCVNHRVPIMAGAYTPTEIQAAADLGADIVKVFPARNLGPNYVRDVLAPMPELQLMPTGGIDLNNLEAYIDAGATAVGIGGNLVDSQLVDAQQWETISTTAEDYSRKARR